MTHKFLLPCPQCSESTPVQASQAGSRVECGCGNRLEVPTIRQLADLESVVEAPQAAPSEWTARSGTKLFGLFFALIAALPGFYLLATWPDPPPRDVPGTIEFVEEAMAQWTIDRSWFYWYNEVELRGLNSGPAEDRLAYLTATQRRRWFCYASFGLASLGLVVVLAAVFVKPTTQ